MCLCAYRCSLCRVSHVNLLLFDFTYYLLEPLGPWIINLLQTLYFASFFELYPQLCVCACGFGFSVFGFLIEKLKNFFMSFQISKLAQYIEIQSLECPACTPPSSLSKVPRIPSGSPSSQTS